MFAPRIPDHPFTTAEAAARLGLDRKALTRAVSERRLVRLFTGVYLRADVEVTTAIRAQAARLVTSPHSVLCDRTAAWLLGLDVLRYAELDVPPPLESYVLRGHDPTDRLGIHGGTRDLLREDWLVVEGVRVTTPVRTALDLTCRLPRREAMAALDAFARAHGVTRQELQRLLLRYFRRRGVVQARQLVPLVDGRSESAGESWARLEIIDRGLPAPEPQVWVYVDGVPTYRLDLAYRRARVAVEYDGEEWHASPEARERDRARREWLRAHGWTVIVLTKESFTPEAVDEWIRELRGALGLR
jgi:hypothetical protein